MKRKSENLIVIVGNGFDLAHNLKTGFSHFAEYYLDEKIMKEVLDNLNKSKIIEDNFKRKVENAKHQKKNPHINKVIKQSNILDLMSSFEKPEYIALDKLAEAVVNGNIIEIKTLLSNELFLFENILTNSFLGKLYSNSHSNWFDIEQTYYKELINILNDENVLLPRLSNSKEVSNKEKLLKLNNEFEHVKQEFKKYLENNIKVNVDKNVSYSLENHFMNRKNVTIINFNYTNTINPYIDRNHRIKNIHIHGDLNREIIFGYGDDTNSEYKKMKGSKEKEYLRNFKTFYYFKSTDYRKVINELDSKDNYDILVVGHSLDTTDKTILKKILDTPKCDYIELLKRSDLESEEEKQEAHFELYANLSRIFDSENDLRDKLIPYPWSVNFPVMTGSDQSIIHVRDKELYMKKKTTRIVSVSK